MRTRLMRTSLLTPLLLALLFVAAGNAFGQIDSSVWYQIKAKHSNKCLAVAGGNSFINDGVGVIQWECIETEDNQKWQILPVGFGYYKIIAKHSGKSLEVGGGVGSLTNGDPVQQWEYVGAANQQWWLNPVDDGYYQIVAAHSRKSLDITGGPEARGDGPHAQQWDYWGGDNQKWKLIVVGDTVTGTFTYSDAENTPDGQNLMPFFRPIVGCRVQVWRAGSLASTTETDSNGRFSVSVPHMPDDTDTTVLIYATNAAAQVLAGFGPFYVRRTRLSQGTATLDFSGNFPDTEQVRSFNAAHDILLAYNFARGLRDPHETEIIPIVDVSFDDTGSFPPRYNHLASGIIIPRRDTWSDLAIMHEYAHFLQDKIGGFLAVPNFHDGCFNTQRCATAAECANLPGLPDQTQLINSPEVAWMEGFASYFALAVKRANPTGQFNLTAGPTATEAELNNPPPCSAVGRAAFDGRTINGEMIENFVASVLWEASRSPGSDAAVFQIFDHELDGTVTGRLPNIRWFREAWLGRSGFDLPRLDAILRSRHLESVVPSGP